MKNSSNKRHTHKTTAGLEDALAIALEVMRETQAMMDYLSERMDDLNGVILDLRKGPDNYDPDRQSGNNPNKRPSLKRRN